MKKFILAIILLITANFFYAQEQQEVNAFQQSENIATGTVPSTESKDGVVSGPTNPPGPELEIPIDEYLPMLVVVGFFLALYRFRYKIKSL